MKRVLYPAWLDVTNLSLELDVDFFSCRSVLRVLRRKLVRIPQISPEPTQAEPSNEFRKLLATAQKLKKENGDSYLGVDTLLQALVETSKDVQEALNEAGRPDRSRPGVNSPRLER